MICICACDGEGGATCIRKWWTEHISHPLEHLTALEIFESLIISCFTAAFPLPVPGLPSVILFLILMSVKLCGVKLRKAACVLAAGFNLVAWPICIVFFPIQCVLGAKLLNLEDSCTSITAGSTTGFDVFSHVSVCVGAGIVIWSIALPIVILILITTSAFCNARRRKHDLEVAQLLRPRDIFFI